MNARHAAKVTEAAAYGRSLGDNAASHYLRGISAADAVSVLGEIRRGTLAGTLGLAGIAERVSAPSLARDLGVRPGTALAADMHAAMVGAYGPALIARAADIAERSLSGDIYA